MKEIQLRIHGLSAAQSLADTYLLILAEVYGDRKVPVLVNAFDAELMKKAYDERRVRLPLIYEAFRELVGKLDVRIKRILIYKVKDGAYFTYIVLDKDGTEIFVDCCLIDALILAIKAGTPIFAYDSVMDQQYVRNVGEGAFSVMIGILGLSQLKELLEESIREERYEEASWLRDEIRRREEENNEEREE